MELDSFNLTGRSALITGAAGLLGAEHAAGLLETGCRVILTDINYKGLECLEKKLKQKFPEENVIIKKMDVTDLKSIKEVSNALKMSKIKIKILINNAAIDPKVLNSTENLEISRIENFDLKQWSLELDVGLKGPFLCSQVFGSDMAKNNTGGVIVNVASDLSIFSPDQRLYKIKGVPDDMQPVKPVTYSVIKHGLVGLTKYLATYWADKGVRCNALSPGGVLNGQNDDFVNKLNSLVPLGRMAKKNEYRAAIQFLCSDASSYMNGQNIVIDGGRSIW